MFDDPLNQVIVDLKEKDEWKDLCFDIHSPTDSPLPANYNMDNEVRWMPDFSLIVDQKTFCIGFQWWTLVFSLSFPLTFFDDALISTFWALCLVRWSNIFLSYKFHRNWKRIGGRHARFGDRYGHQRLNGLTSGLVYYTVELPRNGSDVAGPNSTLRHSITTDRSSSL